MFYSNMTLSPVVSEIFMMSKKCHDLEILVKGQSRSLKIWKCYHSIDWVWFPIRVHFRPLWTKFTIQHLPSVMVLQFCPSPSARNLGFIFDAHLTFPIRFLHSLARASTTSGISDAFALSLTSVQPTSLAHHSYTQSSITATHCNMVFQKPS